MTPDLPYSGWIVAGFSFGLAVFERLRGIKRAASHEVVDALKIDRDAWKSASDAAHHELITYRDETHKRLDDAQKRMLALAEENATLRSATDLTVVVKFQQEQSQINVKMMSSLDLIIQHLEGLGASCPIKKRQPPRKIRGIAEHHRAD